MFHYFPFSVQTDLAAALVVHENVPLVRGMRPVEYSLRGRGREGEDWKSGGG